MLAAPLLARMSYAAGSITMAAPLGSFGDAIRKKLADPFTKETGIVVNIVPGSADLAKVKAQLTTGNVELDIFTGTPADAAYGSKHGYWEQLDLSVFDANDLSVQPKKDVVAYEIYTSGIAWDPEKYSAGKHPEIFRDMFDPNKFPGRRAFRNTADGTMEAALLADGVDPKDMYPLDVERAFKVLDRIKSSVSAWTTTSPQTVSLLQTGEVDFSYTFAGRVLPTNRPGGGKPLAFSFKQNIFFADPLMIVKGAPNKESAMKFLSFILRPEAQAGFAEATGTAPISNKAMSAMSPESRKWLPDLNTPGSLFFDPAYWTDAYETVQSRFKEWILS
ncbi:ABC transporter substrate-binding protein [Bradyrhizobium sp. UFLA05-112]